MNRPNTGTFGAVVAGAAAIGVCCGFPLLASLGVASLAAGVGFGSWLLIGVALSMATMAFARRRRRHCSTLTSGAATPLSTCCDSSDTDPDAAWARNVRAATARDDLR